MYNSLTENPKTLSKSEKRMSGRKRQSKTFYECNRNKLVSGMANISC